MNRLRVLVACLLMLVVPLQGFAAASLAFCIGHAGKEATVTSPAQHVHEQHAAVDHDGAAQSRHDHAGHEQGAAGHHCGTCAACCHGIGIAGSWTRAAAPRLPASGLVEPLVRIANEPLPLPDRPPRA